MVQSCAMETWTRLGTPPGRSFRDNLDADSDVVRMVKPAELTAAMDPGLHLRSVDRILERVFG
jgi:adenylosuccinate lyase